jgi:hypothetical protein
MVRCRTKATSAPPEDGVPSLVFVTRRETVRHLRRDRRSGPGLVYRRRAGLGQSRCHTTVLGWFREGPRGMTGALAGARHPSSPTLPPGLTCSARRG